jgi:phosphoglycerol transferase MdoB-like AlkP superfamily enzyme
VPQIRCALKLLDDFFKELKASGLYDRATIIVHGDHGTSAFQTRPSAYTMEQLNDLDLREAFSTLFAVKLPGGTFRINEEITSLNVLMAGAAGEITGISAEELGAAVTHEEEPFVYLIDVFPLRRAYVNIFGAPAEN